MSKIDLSAEVNAVKRRIKTLNDWLDKAEKYLFHEDYDFGEVRPTKTRRNEIRRDYESAKKTQIELIEFVRRYKAQNPEEDSDSAVKELAEQLSRLSDDDLKHVRKAIMQVRSK